MAEQPLFVRPPSEWDELSDEEQYDWCLAFVEALTADAEGDAN